VNYSNITLKVSGNPKKGTEEKPAVADVEKKINAEVLRIPECGVCSACTEKTTRRKICHARAPVRDKIMAATFKKLPMKAGGKTKVSKKRKAEPLATSPPSSVMISSKTMTTTMAPSTTTTQATTAATTTTTTTSTSNKKKNALKRNASHNGNKKMEFLPELLPEFCHRISANGTGQRADVVSQFAKDHPDISLRQVTLKMTECTQRERPPWIPEPARKPGQVGRTFMVYLRPRFYKYLPEHERPANWEEAAAADEQKWLIERAKAAEADKTMSETEQKNGSATATATSASPGMPAEPPTKKIRVEAS